MTKRRNKLPPELPEKPRGWTRRLALHMSFEDGGAATYQVIDADGKDTPIGYQYDTRPDGLTGFTLPDVAGAMTWAELRAKWPEWIKSRAQGVANAEMRRGAEE